jgi:hypothetical protein
VLGRVSVTFPAGSTLLTARVVRTRGDVWFAVAAGSELRVFRWRAGRWLRDGTARVPREMPFPSPAGRLSSIPLASGPVPAFAAREWGADTEWFALADRLDGRWEFVPFDDQFGPRHSFTFASGTSHGLIEGIFDASGAASGPTTVQWYRLDRNVFVPTGPPQGRAPCSFTALHTAEHWFPIPPDPLLRHMDRPFRPLRFACADGWALATDGRNLSVYKQGGGPKWAVGRGDNRLWLRVGVGSAHLLGTTTEYAMSRSLLDRLARVIHVRIPAATPQPASKAFALTRRQRATITLPIGPGDTYVPPTSLFNGNAPTLVATIISSHGNRVIHFRWRHGAWVRAS